MFHPDSIHCEILAALAGREGGLPRPPALLQGSVDHLIGLGLAAMENRDGEDRLHITSAGHQALAFSHLQ